MELELQIHRGRADADELEAVRRALMTVLAQPTAQSRPRVVMRSTVHPLLPTAVPVELGW